MKLTQPYTCILEPIFSFCRTLSGNKWSMDNTRAFNTWCVNKINTAFILQNIMVHNNITYS